ncbi:uncharacterized protein N7515_001169 [Penicillium bovifimosum]|uniref:F-box domain-containing protein n=1 Tax=Penicillium bovifimosum TaxID=126998 RepID=A0A9W9LC36_9EURO|nr:uncharacterized protein N7515_001169 [Penicillium bovifimosum]KAJ5146605.1 hypothetical protein N7515_001169 [Penicillium bovifimosum]
MLAALPSELLAMVIGQIASRRDLKRLCEVCKRLHGIAIPHLYQSLVLSAPELSLEDLTANLEAIPWKYLKYTQHLGFIVPIHERLESRCVHQGGNGHFVDEAVQDGNMDYEDTAEGTDNTREVKKINKIAQGRILGPLFNLSSALDALRFPDDQLRSFRLVSGFLLWPAHLRESRWEVGTCLPEALFGSKDSFLGNQRQIQSITFITDGECGANTNAQYSVDLVQFRGLRSLDWRGLNRFNDFESVRKCIEVHGYQIQSLTLDLLTWVRAEKIWADGYRCQNPQPTSTPNNFFSERVLNVHPGDQKVVFLSLENLHLSAVSFYHTPMEMAHAFNIERLKSLKLRNCPGSLDWLQMILNPRMPMRLKSVELALDLNSLPRGGHMHITETICNLIHHVCGLESLYLMLPEPIDWTTLTNRLSSHRHIKRFVMHHLVDRGGQKLIDGDIPWSLRLERILQENQLSCFGSSIPPGKLPSWFSESLYTYDYGDDLPYKPEEIHDLAQWAFSADGLPNLQVLAWGDFSYGGRYSKFNLLLCKSDNGYQTLTPSDIMSWNLVQDNLDMLAACPLDDILE